jgi:hypothetical protein
MTQRIPITVWIEVPDGAKVSVTGNGDGHAAPAAVPAAPQDPDADYVRGKLESLHVRAPDALLNEYAPRRIIAVIDYTLRQGDKVKNVPAYIVNCLAKHHVVDGGA